MKDIRDAVKQVIVEMACNDELPADLTNLDIETVFNKAEEILNEWLTN